MFLHGLNQKRATWTLMAEALQARGVAVLTMDLRGHGESVRRITAYGAQILDASKFTGQDHLAMMMDIETAYAWLEKQPGIDRTRIGLVGTSVSANLAIRYAAINRQLGALVVLSPMVNTGSGLRTDDAIKDIGPMPLRIFVSRHDSFSFSSCERLIAIRKEQGLNVDSELVVCTGPLHGTDMMVGVKKLPGMIVDYLDNTLKKTAVERPPNPTPQP
jgi:dienelactone hydrolase